MSDLERAVQDALSKYFGPNTSTGGLRRVLKKVLDAHLKEDAETRRRWIDCTKYIGEAETSIQEWNGYDVNISLPDNITKLQAELAELREAVRALKNQPCDTTIIVNRDVWNRLVEEDDRVCKTSPDNYDDCTCQGRQHWR